MSAPRSFPPDPQGTAARILERDGRTCTTCGMTSGPMYVDHRDLAGDDTDANLRTLCETHHRRWCGEVVHAVPPQPLRLRPPERHPGLVSHDYECDCPACTWWSA